MSPISSSAPNEERISNASEYGMSLVPAASRIFGEGEMADRVRSFPWGATSIGSIEVWPAALIWAINTMLESAFPTSIFWGPEMLHFYNDAYMPLSAEKHPGLLGQPAAVAWAEAWHLLGPQFDSVLKHGRTVFQENVLVPVLRNGRLKDVYWTYSYSPLRDVHGQVSGILIVCHDVTNVLEAQREKEENELKLAAFVDLIPTLAWMANGDGWIFWYNRRWYDYTGTTYEQMQGWGWQSVHDPAMLPEVLTRWNESIETGEPFEMIFPLRGKDGALRSFITRVSPVKDSGGKVTRWFGTNTEIDELNRTRNELAAERSRLNAVIEHVPVGLVFSDASGKLLGGNSEVERILRHPVLLSADVEEYGKWVSYHPSGDQVLPHEYPLAKTLQDGGVHTGEFLYHRGDGTKGWVTFTSAPIRDVERGVIGAVVVTLDIDRRKCAEEALRKSEKLAVAGRLAATIAHEINNPLEAVTNLLYILRTSTQEDHALETIILAEEELARVTEIVTHSLRFHRSSVSPTFDSLSRLLDSAAAVYKSRLLVGDVRISRRFRDTRSVWCYSSELRQVFGNLIGNAFDAIRRGGTIFLRTRDAVDTRSGVPGVRVTVADTGVGMDTLTLHRISEPFFTTKGVNGTGLGLWISRDILKKHNAHLQVRSCQTEQRTGTVFSIFLPSQAKD